ncbi:ATP-binding protein [Chloroflexota bacterium]
MNLSMLLPPLFTFIVNLILILIVSRGTTRSFIKWLFCTLLLSLGLWGLFLFGMRASPDVHHALTWDRAVAVTFYFSFVLYYHFTLAYTKNSGQRRILLVTYLLLIFFIAIAPTSLIVERMRVASYGYAPVIGPLAILIGLGSILLMIGGGYNLVRRYITSPSQEERTRLVYLVIATAFPLTGALLDAFSDLPPMGIWGVLVFCFLSTVSIIKYHLLDIRIIVRKGLTFLLVSGAIAVPYVGMIFIISGVFRQTTMLLWAQLILVLLLAVILRPLYSRAQQFVDRAFYRDRYNYLMALEDFLQETHDIRDLAQLTSSLVNLIGRALASSNVRLMLPSASGDFIEVPSTNRSTTQLVLPSHGSLLRWVINKKTLLHRKDLELIPQLQSLTRSEMNVLNKTRAELIVPIVTKEKELAGLIILGEKLSQMEYTTEDERLIVAVAQRMATELENARLYNLENTARQELERMDEEKTEFLHSVAHELKTPLTAILSSSELLNEYSSITTDINKRIFRNIQQSALVMNSRVSELLNLAEIQIGEPPIKLEPVRIGKVIAELEEQLSIIFEKKKQTMKLEVPKSLPRVNANREKLEQVLFNVLSNANKFSPGGSEIVLRIRGEGTKVVIEVEDSGPTINEVEKTKIFDLYYRGGNAKKKDQFPGLGLGLAISKRIVELHKGEMWVKSKPTKGNIFAFSLPALYSQTKGVK